ncbi:hypothetical protein BHM03_00037878 [Ensete ventricosum]|nr:hypothetical protein BHM03_00037878 [Ensete ventricosum]
MLRCHTRVSIQRLCCLLFVSCTLSYPCGISYCCYPTDRENCFGEDRGLTVGPIVDDYWELASLWQMNNRKRLAATNTRVGDEQL